MTNRPIIKFSDLHTFKGIVVGLLYIQFLAVAPKAIRITRDAEDKFEASRETEKKRITILF